MSEDRIKLAPDTVAYADGETHELVVEFAIPGAPTDTIDVKILGDSIHCFSRSCTKWPRAAYHRRTSRRRCVRCSGGKGTWKC